jgi:uncharacterized protein
MHVDHPFHFDFRGHTAETDDEDYIRDLIELVLFTAPGERVNRPTFGCGVRQLVFAPNSEALAAATQITVQGALQQWLGELIEAQSIEVSNDDAVLNLRIRYVIRRTQRQQTATFTRAL